MAKKKLILNESVTRRFMKLATIKPTYVSNFLTEAEEDEEMMGDEEPAMEPEMEAEPEMDAEMEVEDEMEAPAEEGGAPEAEGLVMDLLAKVQEFAEANGVSMELEGDEEEGEDLEMDAEPEGMEMDAELEGGEDELADEEEMPEDAEANYDGEGNKMMEEVEADLEAADISVIDEEEVIAEVTRRVARRLLKESNKRRK